MKTLTVIGVSAEGGFGNLLADSLSDEYAVTRHGRGDHDWKLDSDVVVLNMFDRERPLLQVIEFDRLFSRLKNTNNTLVAIGSTIHYVNKNQTPYANGKCALHRLFYGLALNTNEYQCNMVLIEAGREKTGLVDVVRSALTIKQRFLHIAVQNGEQK